MAENKKSFILYADLIHTAEELTDEEAGKLFKHILRYVNDKNPDAPDRITKIAFEPVKQQLKRDLQKYESIKSKRSLAGKASAETRQQNQHMSTSDDTCSICSTNPTVNDNVNDNGNVNVNDNANVILNQDIGDEIIIPKKTWKNDFEIYKENVRNGYREIMEDEAWFKKQREFYPNVDILKSIEKSCVNFWITEGGWKNKKKAKTETINWKNTFANAISQPQNKVYYDRNKDLSTTGNTKSGNYSARNDAEERRRSVDNLADLARAILQEP